MSYITSIKSKKTGACAMEHTRITLGVIAGLAVLAYSSFFSVILSA